MAIWQKGRNWWAQDFFPETLQHLLLSESHLVLRNRPYVVLGASLLTTQVGMV